MSAVPETVRVLHVDDEPDVADLHGGCFVADGGPEIGTPADGGGARFELRGVDGP